MLRSTPNVCRLAPAALIAATLGILSIGAHAQPVCPAPLEPPPVVNPPFSRPTETIVALDHQFVHSATHLQGQPAMEKWAPGLIHRPAGTDIDEMTSAVVVDNPFPTPVTFTLTYFDHLGQDTGTIVPMPPAICLARTITLAAEATHVEAATPLDTAAGCGAIGVGAARITVTSGNGIVGGVLHHAGDFFNGVATDPDPGSPGAGAMEQLQAVQQTDVLVGGPFPLTFSASELVLNGMAPMIAVLNPNPTSVVARVELLIFDVATATATTLPFRPVVIIPPRGTLLDVTGPHLTALTGATNPGVWQQLLFFLLTNPATDFDVSVRVTSLGNPAPPILGSFIAPDLLNDEGEANAEFRMASGMLQGAPHIDLMSPELSLQTIERTDILFANHNAVSTPYTINYRSNTGALLSTFSGTLAPGASARAVPGALGYPPPPVGFGWVDIFSCEPLYGWTVREMVDDPDVPNRNQYHKAYGEILMSTNGAEPGPGFTVGGMNRKVIPITRVGGGWPGYSTAVNDSVSNTFGYAWPFFDLAGASCGANAFAGVPLGFASWTYEDPQAPFCGGTVSGRIDVTLGTVDGLSVAGDPFREWGIMDFGTDPM